jgi:hypothetical protein
LEREPRPRPLPPAERDVAKKKAGEQSAEQQAAAELVRLAKEQGLSLTGPDGLLKQLTALPQARASVDPGSAVSCESRSSRTRAQWGAGLRSSWPQNGPFHRSVHHVVPAGPAAELMQYVMSRSLKPSIKETPSCHVTGLRRDDARRPGPRSCFRPLWTCCPYDCPATGIDSCRRCLFGASRASHGRR